jgi:fibro-slime domain-containing protein
LLAVFASHCESERPRRHRSDSGEGGEDASAAAGTGAENSAGGDPSASGGENSSGATGPGSGASAGRVASGGSAGSSSIAGSSGAPDVPPNCGDGNLDDGEECDDANEESGDGCSATCRSEADCMPGDACSADCGNGALDASEACDDGGVLPEDGCDGECRVEDGYLCSGAPSVCTPANCGDGSIDSTESCDDGNTTPFDGCSATCQVEPSCSEAGCESSCGDGIVAGDEDCDDGNQQDDDGCSSACEVEAGFSCSAANCDRVGGNCVMRLPVTYRDFNAHAVAGGHPDFQPGFNSDGAVQGLVDTRLDADGKPVSLGASEVAYLHGTDAFAEWYRDTPGVNATIPGQMVLWDDGAGGYVNRWGAGGERFQAGTTYANTVYGGPGGTGCEACVPSAVGICQDPCIAFGTNTLACCTEVIEHSFDGNPLFFPIDDAPGILTETRVAAKVPEQYGFAGWPWEDDVATVLGVLTPIPTATAPFPSATHNFNFTTELKVWFRYEAARQIVFRLAGDDDLWVFVNGQLAVDLGGWHVPLDGTITISGGTLTAQATLDDYYTSPTVDTRTAPVSDFGLEEGNIHSVSVFQAERQPEGSSFLIGLSGFELQKSVCVRD